MNLNRILVAAALVATSILTSCDSVEPGDGGGENELITRVTLTLTPQGGGTPVTATYADADGDGILDPGEFTTLALRAGTTYTGAVTFASPDEDVTAEVRAEAAAHQVLFTPSSGVAGRLTITVTDRDANNLPLGLQFTASVSAGAEASGTLRVVLAHYEGVKQAGIPSGEADFDGAFPVTITP
ncbi:MAG TPA: hypothetical protein VD948_09280 [Rhodothermales bacterium]|nr:hypothetical protein [Rhodothermales bacterium]